MLIPSSKSISSVDVGRKITGAPDNAQACNNTNSFDTAAETQGLGLLTADMGEAFTARRKQRPDFGEELACGARRNERGGSRHGGGRQD